MQMEIYINICLMCTQDCELSVLWIALHLSQLQGRDGQKGYQGGGRAASNPGNAPPHTNYYYR